MFDLQPGVHFKKVKLPVLVNNKLYRTRRVVADSTRQGDGLCAHRVAGFGIQKGTGGLFNDLLIAALDRAFALAQVDDITLLVGEHLDFDVTGRDDKLLDENTVIAKAGLRFVLRSTKAFTNRRIVLGHAHPFAATASAGLKHDRIAQIAGNRYRLVSRTHHTQVTGDGGDSRFIGDTL